MNSSTTVGQPQVSSSLDDALLAGRSRRPTRPPGVTWPRPRQRPGRGTGHRVLCIDDEPQVLRYLDELFAMNGFDVDAALDGTTGRAHALAHRYDAMVVDLLLQPEVSGLDVIRAVRAAGRSGAILVFTGRPSIESAVEATQLGATYLIKTEVKGAAIVQAVLEAIAAGAPAVRPLFRTTPGPSRTVLELARTVDELGARSSAIDADAAVRTRVRQELARVLARIDLTFLEFVAAAEAFRVLSDPAHDVAIVLPVAARHLDTAARRVWTDIDPRVRRLVDALQGAGHDWKAIDEAAAGKVASVTIKKLPELLRQGVGLSWPRTRWSVVLRRALLELAATDEQVAQIAYKLGFAHATRLNDALDEYLGATPTEYRQLLEGGGSEWSASEEKRKE
jgi:DNA-binding NarL/FixJ family response regulator/AraC-like DNA-binding protein